MYLVLVCCTIANAQNALNHDKNNVPPVTIRCGGTVSSGSPLFILDGILVDYESLARLNPESIKDICVLKNTEALNCFGNKGKNGVVLISTHYPIVIKKVIKDYPFKVYTFHELTESWNSLTTFANTLLKVPGLQLNMAGTPYEISEISMRGHTNTIVILDGTQQDVSVLNHLNPNDIQSIRVAPSAAATNYFTTNFK